MRVPPRFTYGICYGTAPESCRTGFQGKKYNLVTVFIISLTGHQNYCRVDLTVVFRNARNV